MITVSITDDADRELGLLRIDRLEKNPEIGDYSIEYAVNTAEGFAIYQRSVQNFPRKEFNILGLLRLALDALDEKELRLDGDPDKSGTPRHARLSGHLAG